MLVSALLGVHDTPGMQIEILIFKASTLITTRLFEPYFQYKLTAPLVLIREHV